MIFWFFWLASKTEKITDLFKIEKKEKEDAYNKQSKIKKHNQVEKYRTYRIGDFPDIQIKYAEIIAPLQALAQRDSQIAMILFNTLFM
jgi:DNA-dependent protein kinase catalytic subunit